MLQGSGRAQRQRRDGEVSTTASALTRDPSLTERPGGPSLHGQIILGLMVLQDVTAVISLAVLVASLLIVLGVGPAMRCPHTPLAGHVRPGIARRVARRGDRDHVRQVRSAPHHPGPLPAPRSPIPALLLHVRCCVGVDRSSLTHHGDGVRALSDCSEGY
eukprot:2563704-Rhodomonas_salina.6